MGKYWKNSKLANPAFGEVEYRADGWRTVENRGFSLFDRIYSAGVLAMTGRQTPEEINALQESAYRSFLDRMVSWRSEIE
jgi:cyclopropane fatty-acyl-phospholipid synthase-like methyltransferase